MDGLAFLSRKQVKLLPLVVVHGDEDFLKRQVLRKLRAAVEGDDDNEFAVSNHAGDKAEYTAVMDELQTSPFFSDHRLVVVENADPFVSKHRKILEKAVGKLPESGTLVLEVKTWQSATKLAKMIDSAATIACKAPAAAKLQTWCVDWASAQHNKKLAANAARLLVELIGPEMGLLDRELDKLAAFAGERERISEEDVDLLVGRSQAQNTWKIFDAIGQGNAKEALAILDRLFQQGEEPLRIVGAFSMQLRRLAQAGRLAMQGKSLSSALAAAGVQPYFISGCEQQLRHLGRERAAKLYDWLLELNMDLRGNSPLPARLLLERFVVRLAR